MSHARHLQSDHLLAAATIFAGAFLLFEVEPLIAKAILPWFGGSAQVWTTCLLFFQAALLAGYLYAHILTSRVSPRWQLRIHVALLAASLALLPIVPSQFWKPTGGEDPLWLILGLLASTIGLPFVLLSSTSPLVQAWLARPSSAGVRPPYRLFALSNFGSMLALLSYPVLVEPYLAIRTQAVTWSMLYTGFAALCAVTAWFNRSDQAVPHEATGSPPWARRLLWFCLAAAPSGLLLAMTDFMLQNVAAIPLLWIVPLALYLLSFVFAFNNLRWYMLPHWYAVFAVATGILVIAISGQSGKTDLGLLPVLAGVLFVFCYVCHSELSLLRPEPRHLTEYYLILSAGGAAGGLFVAVVAPTMFNASYELPMLVPFAIFVVLLAALQHYREWTEILSERLLALGLSLTLLAATMFLMFHITSARLSDAILLARNFYGALRVVDAPLSSERPIPSRYLTNGSILHGIELTRPNERRQPLAYYAPVSGVGRLLVELGKEGPLRVGVIGLGVGTLAGYGRPGDDYRFYEINPLVETIARRDFWYLATNPARQSVVLGDARLSLEREPAQHFDVLVVDAFISDSIPIHLLTRQAFALYWHHLKPGGVLAVHVSNRFVDLAPIVAQAAAASGRTARIVRVDESDWKLGVAGSAWVLVTSRDELFRRPVLWIAQPIAIAPSLRPWTDDYSSIWSVLRL